MTRYASHLAQRPIHRPTGKPPRPPRRPPPEVRAAAWSIPSPLPGPLEPPESFVSEAEAAGVEFEKGDLVRLGLYLALLLDANKAFNLTAVRDSNEAWRRHILDSLTLLGPLSELAEGASIIDVGSGGGLPGIPLAIARPDLKFTLLEATGKKAEFLKLASVALELSNVTVVSDRAERAAHDRGAKVASGPRQGGCRERFDAAVARAVGPLAVIAELTVPFVKKGGHVLLIKGEKAGAELEQATTALRTLGAVHVGTLETSTGRIVILEKGAATPRDYPRRDGEPARSPLGGSKGGATSPPRPK